MVNPARLAGPPQAFTWYLTIQGECSEVRCIANFQKTPPIERRGDVGAFSKQSRKRVMRLAAKIDWEALRNSLFISLTYPDQCLPNDKDQRNRHRYLFFRYAEKLLSKEVPILWRIEWEDRKSGPNTGLFCPHLHLIACGCRFLSWRRIRRWWGTIVHVNGPLATDVQKIYDSTHAQMYISKYIAKECSLDRVPYLNKGKSLGRHWGMHRKEQCKWCPIRVMRRISDEQADEIRLMAALQFPGYDPLLGGGFTFLGNGYADELADKFGKGIDDGRQLG